MLQDRREVSHRRNEEYIYLLATSGAPKSQITREGLAALIEAREASHGPLLGASGGARAKHTAPEQALLAALREHGELLARDLERLTGLTSYRVSFFLRRLMDRGEVAARGGGRSSLYHLASAASTESAEHIETPRGPRV